MSDTITLVPLDAEGERIAEAFARQTGLVPERAQERLIFGVHGTEHAIPVVQVLTEIAEHWPAHVELAEPA